VKKKNNQLPCVMTVDVEDYFHVSAFEDVISQKDWNQFPLRVEQNTYRLLELFEQHQAKCTFFILGWVAEKCPKLVKSIVTLGHEVASHGHAHQRVVSMTRKEFFSDVERSKKVLEDISGKAVLGYRAPSFSINDSNTWAFDVLIELGFEYSSSTYPIKHDLYGVPDWPRFCYKRPEGILEIPIPTLRKNSRNIGIGGGGYFRLYPYMLSNKRIQRYLLEEKQPYNFYFPPWEVDPEQPKIKGASFKSKLRHYLNLSRMENKLIKLLEDYQWSTMKDTYLGKN
jgi:polysaccharide deacetylase family protein (PEP-CTERM system associated)